MEDGNNTRELLEKLFPKPLSPEIRKKILSTAYQGERKFQVVTPIIRRVFAVCCLLIAAALGFDSVVKNGESSRLTAMMNGAQAAETIREEELRDAIKELFIIDHNENLARWFIRHQENKRRAAELLDFQRFMDILKE